MMKKRYTYICEMRPDHALNAIQTLLSKESVEYTAAEFSAISTDIPIPLVNIDRRLYSRNNWIGLNPFLYLSAVEVQCRSRDLRTTTVTVSTNRLRAIAWALFYISLGLVTLLMPQPAGAIIFAVICCASWMFFVIFLGDYLVKEEIRKCLENSAESKC